jgi:putative hemolysin
MRAALLLALLLAACSPAAPPKPTEGAAQKARMDAATTAYANCISEGARTVAVADEAAGTIANRVVVACKPLRQALMADIIAFNQIGHPKYSIEQSKAVAEASVATAEDELRRQTVVSIVQRQTSETAPAAPAKAS